MHFISNNLHRVSPWKSSANRRFQLDKGLLFSLTLQLEDWFKVAALVSTLSGIWSDWEDVLELQVVVVVVGRRAGSAYCWE